MLALATVQATVFDVPHLFRVATPKHLGHQAIVIRGLIPRMGVLKRLPVIGKDLLEDTPVPRGCCNHRVAPSGGDTIVTVQRLYHGLPASSTPHQPVYGHPHLPRSSLINGSFRDWKNAFSYTIKLSHATRSPRSMQPARRFNSDAPRPLFWLAGCAPARRGRSATPRSCVDQTGAADRPDRR